MRIEEPVTLLWEDIYRRLLRDREDAVAWQALAANVRLRARRELRQRGWHAVDDVVADTCASVALSMHQARGADTFRGFVLGNYLNARRQALKQYAASLEVHISIDPDSVPDTQPESGAGHSTHDWHDLLGRAVALLPPRERQAVMLRYFEDMSYAELARALGTSDCNARQILFRGRRRLHSILQLTTPGA